jgi:hypothetical protein
MATHVTRWLPDTCECVIDYEWDDANPSVLTHKEMIKVCAAHAALGLADKACFDKVRDENVRKNMTLAEAQKAVASVTLEDFTWSFDKDRNLVTDFKGKVSALQKLSIDTEADKRVQEILSAK